MKKYFLLLLMSVLCRELRAQQNVTGEYYLEGIMETASGFKLNADSTFEFFFSYGALDRSGSGTWMIQDGRLVLNSRIRPLRDFALVNSGLVAGKGITIKIIEPNTMLLKYVECLVRSGADSLLKITDDEGIAKFEKRELQTIELLFQLCPDRRSVFSVDGKKHNYFEFRFEPWIAEVFFTNFILEPSRGQLVGKHPLLEDKLYTYKKQL